MGVTDSNCLSFWWRFALGLSICNVVFTLKTKRCITSEEHLLRDMPRTLPLTYCNHRPGRGPYTDCNITDLRTDLSKVGLEVRSLCIFTDIASIPANAFSHLPSLEVLQIVGESLENIQSGAFSGLPNLKYLRLLISDRICRSIAMESLAFAGLTNLEELTLEGLNLTNVSINIFDPLVSVIKLDINRTCSLDLSDIFCYLPVGMSHLKDLNVINSGISTIETKECPGGSKTWPVTVLSGIQNLCLIGNSIKIIQANSLVVFQNLSSLFLEFAGQSLDSIWESGIGMVGELSLTGKKYSTSFKDLCHLVSNLHLQSLSLVFISTDILSAKHLKDCGTTLTKLFLSRMEIDYLDFCFWTGNTGMQALQMAQMKLTEAPFCVAVKGTVSSLTSLDLTGNSITYIAGDQFACMPLLEQLFLSDNAIKTLQLNAFRGLHHLKILKLDLNKISQLTAKDFRTLQALEVLLINDNIIKTIEDGTFQDQRELRELSFGRLEYVFELHLNRIFYVFPPKIRRLSIDVKYGTTFFLGSTPQPEGPFLLELSGDRLDFVDCNTTVFTAVRELKVNCTFFRCKNDLMAPYFPNLESFEFLEESEKARLSYTKINTLHRLKRLKLTDLNFNYTEAGSVFRNLTQLQTLVLVNCHLSFLTECMFQDLTSLQLLRLYSDSPLVLIDGMFEVLPVLTAFVLDRVDFQCSCENGWIIDWAESTEKVQVINLQKQNCVWHYKKLNFLVTMKKLCQTDLQYICYVATAGSVCLLLSAAVGYRFARWPSIVLSFRLRGWVERRFGRQWHRRRRRRVEEIEEMQYDAFVSFCSRDEAWALGELVPRLEEQGNPRLRLCLHNRDFEVRL